MLNEENRNHFKDALIDFTAGSLGGIALVYVGQPFDTIKVKMQTYPGLHGNMISCFNKTIKTEGFYRGLYAGTVPALLTNITENAILFVCYGFCQKFIQKITKIENTQNLRTIDNAMAGFLASFFSSIAICPTELIKCKLQAQHELEKFGGTLMERIGPFQLANHIIKTQGIRGLFTGLTPTLAREMPGYFFFFGGYEGTRQLFAGPNRPKDDIGLWRTMVAGAVGGIVFWTSTFPIDVVKSRIQVNNQIVPQNMLVMMVQITRQEGVFALYNGLLPTLLRTVPSTATLFVTYEYSKKMLNNFL